MIKRNMDFEGIVERVLFADKGIVMVKGTPVQVRGTVKGQYIKGRITRRKKSNCKGRLLEIVTKAPHEVDAFCEHYGIHNCGGCSMQTLSYEDQISRKEEQVQTLLANAGIKGYKWHGIEPCPKIYEYRNKMEFSFGDEYKDGPLSLGMHRKGARFDIITVDGCKIVDEDFSSVLRYVLNYCQEQELSFYHKMDRKGYLRYLIVRKSDTTGEILVNLVTTTQDDHDWSNMVEGLVSEDLIGHISGFIHTTSDNLGDAVNPEGTNLLYGKNYITEELLGLKFKISPYSFFQTNSRGASVLYQSVIDMVGDLDKKTVFDLYSGTGTIAQIMATAAKSVYGIEIVEEAVEAAKENAKLNNLDNCKFIAGDVLKKVDELEERPDLIVIDPPREGINPRAIGKILDFGAPEMIYVSCNPVALMRDLKIMMDRGYKVTDAKCVDMFAHTGHVETVVRVELE